MSNAALGHYAGNIRGRVELEAMRREREQERLRAAMGAIQSGLGAGLDAANIGANTYLGMRQQTAKAESDKAALAQKTAQDQAAHDLKVRELQMKEGDALSKAAGRKARAEQALIDGSFGGGSSAGGASAGGKRSIIEPIAAPDVDLAIEDVKRFEGEEDILGPGAEQDVAARVARERRAGEKSQRDKQIAALVAGGIDPARAEAVVASRSGGGATDAGALQEIRGERARLAEKDRVKPFERSAEFGKQAKDRTGMQGELRAGARAIAGMLAKMPDEEAVSLAQAGRASLLARYEGQFDPLIINGLIDEELAGIDMDAAKRAKIMAQTAVSEREAKKPYGTGKAPKPLSERTTTEIGEVKDLIQQAKEVARLHAVYKRNSAHGTGQLAGPGSKLAGLVVDDPDFINLTSANARLKTTLMRLQAGTSQTASELRNLIPYLPDVSDDDDAFAIKAGNMVGGLEKTLRSTIDALTAAGHNIGNLDAGGNRFPSPESIIEPLSPRQEQQRAITGEVDEDVDDEEEEEAASLFSFEG